MKIFVTGASGFIGSCLCRKLLAEGHSVSMLVRDQKKIQEFLKMGFIVIKGDLFDKEKILAGMDSCDWVFHLAAYAKPTSSDPELPYRTNVEGTENILASALKSANVSVVVVTSTAGTMGYSRDGRPVGETTNRDVKFHTEYERTKSLAERLAMSASNEKTRVVVVNPSRVFGPGRLTKSNSVTRIIRFYGMGLWRIIPGNGISTGNYAFIDDVVNGHILAAMHGKAGERYILGGENLTFNEFFRILGEVYGKERPMLKLSSDKMKFLSKISSGFLALAGKPPFISDGWIEKYLENWSLSCQKAIQDLNYTITPFHEAVEKTVDWLRTENTEKDRLFF